MAVAPAASVAGDHAAAMVAMAVMPAVMSMAAAAAETDAEAESRGSGNVGRSMPNHNRCRANHRRGLVNDRPPHDDGRGLIDDRALDHYRRGLTYDGLTDDHGRCVAVRGGGVSRRGLCIERRLNAPIVMVDGFGEHGGGDDAGQHLACGGPFLVSGGCLLCSCDRHRDCCQR